VLAAALIVLLAPPAAAEPAWRAAARAAAVGEAADGLRYELRRYGAAPALAARLETVAVPDPGGNPTTAQVVAAAARSLSAGLSPAERAALEKARRRTLSYFGGEATPLFSPAPRADAGPALSGGWPSPADLPDGEPPMRDAAGYAASRLGALGALARAASAQGLSLALVPGPVPAWPPDCRPADPVAVRFPSSSDGFSALAADCAGGGSALVAYGFAGRSLFVHESALLRVLTRGLPRPPRAFHDPAGTARPRGDLLLAPFAAGSGLPRRFDALALGYYRELRDALGARAGPERSGPGWRGFSTRVGTTSLVAVAVDASWYGENLGASLAGLLDGGVSFRSVYFAGSAGGLNYHPPYSLVLPGCFLSLDGGRVDLPDALSGDADQPCHLSAASPLVETRAVLERAAREADSVDVEGWSLARTAASRGLELGAAYLITDYPAAPASLRGFVLSRPRAAARLDGARAYARLLLERLRSGRRAYRHPLEDALQAPLDGFSAAAARRAREELGALTSDEDALLRRVSSATPPAVFRTRPARLAHILRDGAALAPEEVDRLRGGGSAGSSLVPDSEEALYGARDYLFAGLGQNDSAELYGPLRVYLSTAAWRGAFATRTSGARFLAERFGGARRVLSGSELAEARAAFARDACVPRDAPSRLAALAVAGYRRLARERGEAWAGPRRRAAADAPDDAALWRLLDADTDAYLELKIPVSFQARDIVCVEADPGTRLRERGRSAGRSSPGPGPSPCPWSRGASRRSP
jgi:hypothetical protein